MIFGFGFPFPLHDRKISSPLKTLINPFFGVFSMVGGSEMKKKYRMIVNSQIIL